MSGSPAPGLVDEYPKSRAIGLARRKAEARDHRQAVFRAGYAPWRWSLVFRRDDPAFAAVVERTFARMASERRLAELYNKWFLRRLPTGETLNLPMSPQLEEVFRMVGQPE